MYNFLKNKKTIVDKIKNTKLFRFHFLRKYNQIRYRKEKITVFHLNKTIYHKLKKNIRVRRVFFFEINLNQLKLFMFNKPKSKVVKKKKKVIG